MVSIILWFMILSSGSVLCAAIWNKRYEEIIPITCSFIVIVLFLCGLAGNLLFGGALVCLFGIAAYVTAAIWIIRKKRWSAFARNFFTSGLIGFVIIIAGAFVINYHKMASGWDEFSHWADIVKAMATLNDFGTNPEAHSAFQSYPPGMSLFQYFLQKLYAWTGPADFSEWHLYIAYQIFVFAFMAPFLKELSIKKPIKLFIALLVLFLSPLLFYPDIYSYIYIDPFLGVLSGTGLAAIFLCKERDAFYSLRIALTMAMLVLAKDAGILFAIFLGIAYVIDYVHGSQTGNTKSTGKLQYNYWICVPIAIFSICLPKLLWNIHLKITNAYPSFSRPYDIGQMIQIILGKETGWQQSVWKNFYRQLTSRVVVLGNTNFRLNYYVMLFFLMGLVILVCLLYEKKDNIYVWKGRMLWWCIGIQFVVYIIGLCVTYIMKFSEYEAMRFASFERYINIVYLAAWLCFVLLFLEVLQGKSRWIPVIECMTIVVILLISPQGSIISYIYRDSAHDSMNARAQYQEISAELEKIPDKSNIYVISQETSGYDFWVIKYIARPHSVLNYSGWSIGEPFYDGDIWTINITAAEWQEELSESYDYVILYRVNDYFLDNYASLFQRKGDIQENSLYKMNKETGLLEKCE